MSEHACTQCGVGFKRQNVQPERQSRNPFCSRRCYDAYRALNPGFKRVIADSNHRRMATIPSLDLSGLSVAERAYLAGFTDGEGTITVVPARSSARRHSYYAIYTVVNTHLATMQHLASLLGCGLLHQKNGGRDCKDVYKIIVRATADVLHVLETLYPYLITKRRQADLAMTFCRRRLARQDWSNGQSFAEDAVLSDQIRQLNRRGRIEAPVEPAAPRAVA